MKSQIFRITSLSVLLCSSWLIAPNVYADGESSFRCERMREVSLTDLKAKLVENCDLNKPFSFTQEPALKIGFIYCCNTKKQEPVKTAPSAQ